MKNSVDPKQILHMAERRREYSTKLLAQLVEIPSISGKEEKIIRFLERTFSQSSSLATTWLMVVGVLPPMSAWAKRRMRRNPRGV